MVKDSCPFKGMLACLSWRQKHQNESFNSKENIEKYGSTPFSLSKKEEIVNFPLAQQIAWKQDILSKHESVLVAS